MILIILLIFEKISTHQCHAIPFCNHTSSHVCLPLMHKLKQSTHLTSKLASVLTAFTSRLHSHAMLLLSPLSFVQEVKKAVSSELWHWNVTRVQIPWATSCVCWSGWSTNIGVWLSTLSTIQERTTLKQTFNANWVCMVVCSIQCPTPQHINDIYKCHILYCVASRAIEKRGRGGGGEHIYIYIYIYPSKTYICFYLRFEL